MFAAEVADSDSPPGRSLWRQFEAEEVKRLIEDESHFKYPLTTVFEHVPFHSIFKGVSFL